MKEQKSANLLAGSTNEAQAGKKSSASMKHGEESRAMLLALLNSPLETMINSQQARIMGTVKLKDGHRATIVFFYDVEPTANTLKLLAK